MLDRHCRHVRRPGFGLKWQKPDRHQTATYLRRHCLSAERGPRNLFRDFALLLAWLRRFLCRRGRRRRRGRRLTSAVTFLVLLATATRTGVVSSCLFHSVVNSP